jgi:hypothetical protein
MLLYADEDCSYTSSVSPLEPPTVAGQAHPD